MGELFEKIVDVRPRRSIGDQFVVLDAALHDDAINVGHTTDGHAADNLICVFR